ncbi:MAG TPA: hypothetical protein P5079_02025 [Elusimicrobiota bacterium]|nr:hypothetical protein [Elusimicrobiota bacterium]
MKPAAFLWVILALLPVRASADDGLRWNLTVLPHASLRYRGEGKVLPESYVNRFAGETSPIYRFELTQVPRSDGYWGVSFWHTGVFGGGSYAEERVPDNTTGGAYQINQLNVGFTNLFVTYHRPVAALPVEARVHASVVREIFKRKQFIVQNVDYRWTNFDDVNEISAEGLGFGLAGRHGGRFYLRWQADAHYYIQLFDAKTDSSAGQIYQSEAALGARVLPRLSVEFGALWQYWFTHSQGNRRLVIPGTDGAVISWNRQETRASGAFLRLDYFFAGRD